jgi:hypothetical protein
MFPVIRVLTVAAVLSLLLLASRPGAGFAPPKDGDEWRVFFGRFEKLVVGPSVASPAWSWGRIGDSDNHIPERFTRVTFSSLPVDRKPEAR